MLGITFAMALAATAPQETSGTWRIMGETADVVIAVQDTDRVPGAGESGAVYILTTFGRPRDGRTGPYRQTWTELSVTCPGEAEEGHYGVVWDRLVEDGHPLPETPEPLSPPIAVRTFDGDSYLGPLSLDICRGRHLRRPTVRGDWATVLRTLRERSDARVGAK